MRFLKQTMAVLGAITTIAVLVAVLAPKSTRAVVAALVQIVPGTTTHVGQNESQMVYLACIVSASGCTSKDASGVVASTTYVVPAGYTLVITDYEWISPGGSAEENLCDQLSVLVGGIPAGLFFSCTIADASGTAYRAEHFISGIRLASGTSIRDISSFLGNGSAQIQGYLVPN